MKLAITGAAGFVGQLVASTLQEMDFGGSVRLIDKTIFAQSDFEQIALDLLDPHALDVALDGVDRVLHLAALPGGAAEADPELSKRVNLDLPLGLMNRMEGRRLVFASSIAVYGDSFPLQVDDRTPARPASVYGTHKRMSELAFGDAVRRELLSGVALRLPGIVARPRSASGFGSAFLSDLFHAIRSGQAMTLPVAPEATSWLMSAKICADNLVHALLADFTIGSAMCLGAVRVRIEDLVRSAARYGDASQISYAEDETMGRLFGSHPPLKVHHSSALGFRDDGALDILVDNVMRDAGFAEVTSIEDAAAVMAAG